MALSQVTTHTLVPIFVDKGVFLGLLAVWNAGDILAAGTTTSPLHGTEAIVQADDISICIFNGSSWLRKIRDAKVRLTFNI